MRFSFFYKVYTLHLVLRIPFENFAVSEYQNNLLIFIFVVVALHLCCCPQTFSSCSFGAQASPSSGFSCCRAQALGHTGLAALQHVESFQTRDGLLHWQVDSYLRYHQESQECCILWNESLNARLTTSNWWAVLAFILRIKGRSPPRV